MEKSYRWGTDLPHTLQLPAGLMTALLDFPVDAGANAFPFL
jgi:hypothetical protein